MSRNRFAEILEYEPYTFPLGGDRGYRRWDADGQGCTTTTAEGMALLIREAQLLDYWQSYFDALASALERCAAHRLECPNHEWELDGYACEPPRDPAHIDVLYIGFHAETDGYCVSAWAHSVPAGLLVEIEGREASHAAR